jgi:hypothetical protein
MPEIVCTVTDTEFRFACEGISANAQRFWFWFWLYLINSTPQALPDCCDMGSVSKISSEKKNTNGASNQMSVQARRLRS